MIDMKLMKRREHRSLGREFVEGTMKSLILSRRFDYKYFNEINAQFWNSFAEHSKEIPEKGKVPIILKFMWQSFEEFIIRWSL